MAWQATLKSITPAAQGGSAIITITYTDSDTNRSFDEDNNIIGPQLDDWLTTHAANRIVQLTDLDTYVAGLSTGDIDTTAAVADIRTAQAAQAQAQQATP